MAVIILLQQGYVFEKNNSLAIAALIKQKKSDAKQVHG